MQVPQHEGYEGEGCKGGRAAERRAPVPFSGALTHSKARQATPGFMNTARRNRMLRGRARPPTIGMVTGLGRLQSQGRRRGLEAAHRARGGRLASRRIAGDPNRRKARRHAAERVGWAISDATSKMVQK
jgi:hypothetical protein